MKVIVTTSDNYHHCLPVFFKQYNKYWGDAFELVGYKQPEYIPDNCTFVSLGEQHGPEYFSDDMAAYFKDQPQFFVWLMEDTFIKGFDRGMYKFFQRYASPLTALTVGRINLTKEGTKQDHYKTNSHIVTNTPTAKYRLSTQPSIWNRDFLLKYLTPGLTPWKFETQPTVDDFQIIGPKINIVEHNEGVRKHDIHNLNLDGIE